MERRKVGSLRNRPKRVHRKVYRFRMEPTREQADALLRMAGARRWVWNWGLARRKEFYTETRRTLTYRQQAAELTAVKGRPEMEADSQLLQQALPGTTKRTLASTRRR